MRGRKGLLITSRPQKNCMEVSFQLSSHSMLSWYSTLFFAQCQMQVLLLKLKKMAPKAPTLIPTIPMTPPTNPQLQQRPTSPPNFEQQFTLNHYPSLAHHLQNHFHSFRSQPQVNPLQVPENRVIRRGSRTNRNLDQRCHGKIRKSELQAVKRSRRALRRT